MAFCLGGVVSHQGRVVSHQGGVVFHQSNMVFHQGSMVFIRVAWFLIKVGQTANCAKVQIDLLKCLIILAANSRHFDG